MTDISEKETIEYFKHGAKKAIDASMKLADVNETKAWHSIASSLKQLAHNADKLYTAKAMTRLQTLSMAAKIQAKIN